MILLYKQHFHHILHFHDFFQEANQHKHRHTNSHKEVFLSFTLDLYVIYFGFLCHLLQIWKTVLYNRLVCIFLTSYSISEKPNHCNFFLILKDCIEKMLRESLEWLKEVGGVIESCELNALPI